MRKAYESNEEFSLALDAARGFGSTGNPWDRTVLAYLAKFDEEKPVVPKSKAHIFWRL
jgi:hypothetical protein